MVWPSTNWEAGHPSTGAPASRKGRRGSSRRASKPTRGASTGERNEKKTDSNYLFRDPRTSKAHARPPAKKGRKKRNKRNKIETTDSPSRYSRRTLSNSCKLRSWCARAIARMLSTSRECAYRVASLIVRRLFTSSGCVFAVLACRS